MRGVAGVDDDRAADEVGLRAGLDVGAGRLGDHRRAEGGEEAAHDQLVDAPLRALEGARVDRLGRVDRRVVGGLLLAAGRGQLAVEQARGGRELRDPDQRGDQLAERQRGRVDGVVGARVGDEAVHVEVLGDPHRARRGDPEAARGVGREGGGVVGRRRLARVRLRASTSLTTPGALGAGERRVGLGLLPELVGRVVGLEGAVGVLELARTPPRRAWRRGRGAPARARRSGPGSGSARGRRRGSWSRSGGSRARPRGSASRPRSGRCPGGRRRRWRARRRARRGRRRRARSPPWSAPSSGRA